VNDCAFVRQAALQEMGQGISGLASHRGLAIVDGAFASTK
jgi:hypothetical protein